MCFERAMTTFIGLIVISCLAGCVHPSPEEGPFYIDLLDGTWVQGRTILFPTAESTEAASPLLKSVRDNAVEDQPQVIDDAIAMCLVGGLIMGAGGTTASGIDPRQSLRLFLGIAIDIRGC